MKQPAFDFDAVVLGGGVAGLGVAIALAEKRRTVAIIEKPQEGQASPLAGGILDPVFEMTPEHPLLELSLDAFKAFPNWIKKLESTAKRKVGYQKVGMIYFAFSRKELEELKKRMAWQSRMGIMMKWLSRNEILAKHRSVNPDVLGGLSYPQTGKVIARDYLEALQIYADLSGVARIKTLSEFRLLNCGGEVSGVQIGERVIRSRYVVNAIGSWSGIHPDLQPCPRVKPARGQIVICKEKDAKVHSIYHSLDGAYIVPWKPKEYLLGSTVEFVGFKPYTTEKGIYQVRHKAGVLVPAMMGLPVIDSWAGLRPCAPDYLPIIGPSKMKGLFMANGFYRSGILIGMSAGRYLCQGMLTGSFDAKIRAFSPQRFRGES